MLTGIPSATVEIVETAPSTNTAVTQRARAGAAEGLVVVAEHQTAGRGRLDRTWETPPRAALTFSVLLRPTREPARWSWLPLLAGLAVAGTLEEVGAQPELKWPNDVLVGGRKVAGLLVEQVPTPSGPAAVVGMGINVSTRPEELPVPTAGSLREAGVEIDRSVLLRTVLERLLAEYAVWQAPDGEAVVRAAYRSRCATAQGRAVRVELPGGRTVTGTGRDLTASGALVVETDAGRVEVNVGDVVHVRAGG